MSLDCLIMKNGICTELRPRLGVLPHRIRDEQLVLKLANRREILQKPTFDRKRPVPLSVIHRFDTERKPDLDVGQA